MFKMILQSHLTRYPEMQIEDVYKLIHQAVMGSEHAITDPETARKWMERESAEMGRGPVEPVIDPISPDGEIIRVHLRPYVLCGGTLEALLDAFIRTANEHHGDIHLLESYWEIAASLDAFPASVMDEFIRSMKAQNYPAVHHSSEYERLYRPAYRVILRKYCLQINKLVGAFIDNTPRQQHLT